MTQSGNFWIHPSIGSVKSRMKLSHKVGHFCYLLTTKTNFDISRYPILVSTLVLVLMLVFCPRNLLPQNEDHLQLYAATPEDDFPFTVMKEHFPV
jgi:hypothetical protein